MTQRYLKGDYLEARWPYMRIFLHGSYRSPLKGVRVFLKVPLGWYKAALELL